MPPAIVNLFERATVQPAEKITSLVAGAGFRLEHIVSGGAASPAGFWYDQPGPEWVALVQGSAVLEFVDGRIEIEPGDALMIPPRCRHRVVRTSVDAVWLAVHYDAEDPAGGLPRRG